MLIFREDRETYKMEFKKTLSFIILFTSLTFSQNIYEGAGTNSNLFLRSDLSARVSGLSGAFTAIANDENALLYNPAGLAKLRLAGIAFNHTQWFEDIRLENLLLGYKISSRLGMGLGVSFMGMPSIQGLDGAGNPTEKLDISSSVIHMGLGYRLFSSAMLGLGVKYFNDNLAGFTASGFAFDLGFYMDTMLRGLSLGLVVQNLGGNIQYDSAKEKIPFSARVGVAYKIPRQDWYIAFDGVKTQGQDFVYNFGIEYILAKYVAFRLGNQALNGLVLSPSFGLGLNIREKYLIDYTFASKEDLGATHRAGITIRFDLPKLISDKHKPVTTYSLTSVKAPKDLRYEILDQKMVVKWAEVPSAVYNVYAKSAKTDSWKKLTEQPLRQTEMDFKRPTVPTKYYITVTSVINNIESAFENELEIEIK